MEKAREELVELLGEYKAGAACDITVVFDGYKSGGSVEQVSFRRGVKVIYSRLGERADEVIKRIIATEHRAWIVASSDREIISRAWAQGSIPVSSERFLDVISRRVGQKRRGEAGEKDIATLRIADETIAGEDDETMRSRKGSARQLSRKEKAVKRALAKLSGVS